MLLDHSVVAAVVTRMGAWIVWQLRSYADGEGGGTERAMMWGSAGREGWR